jgi:hypothetical protein
MRQSFGLPRHGGGILYTTVFYEMPGLHQSSLHYLKKFALQPVPFLFENINLELAKVARNMVSMAL